MDFTRLASLPICLSGDDIDSDLTRFSIFMGVEVVCANDLKKNLSYTVAESIIARIAQSKTLEVEDLIDQLFLTNHCPTFEVQIPTTLYLHCCYEEWVFSWVSGTFDKNLSDFSRNDFSQKVWSQYILWNRRNESRAVINWVKLCYLANS